MIKRAPTIEDLASNLDMKYWKATHKEAQYLHRMYDVPISIGMILSAMHDMLLEFEAQSEEDE